MANNNPNHLEDNLKFLVLEMNRLKISRGNGEGKGKKWLLNVDERDLEVAQLEKELKAIPTGNFIQTIGTNTFKARKKLNKKVNQCLKLVTVLKDTADDISESMAMFKSEVATDKTFQFSPWELNIYTSKLATPIGKGNFAKVYKGEFRKDVQIAVKILNDDVMRDMEKVFMAEVKTLGKAHHRNLVKLYGFCFEPKMKAFVYEFMENGTLENALNDRRLGFKKLYDIANQTAKAIAYLHENCPERIIHRDIKAGNVLLDKDDTPKFTDFGLAKLYNVDKSQVTFTGPREMRDYDAPEVRMGAVKITYKCDVFSLGMMFFDILRGGNFAKQSSFPRLVWDEYEKGKLDEMLTGCGIRDGDKERAKTLSKVALWCIQLAPKDRPYMSNVVKLLEWEIQLRPPPNPFVPFSNSSISRGSSSSSHGSISS